MLSIRLRSSYGTIHSYIQVLVWWNGLISFHLVVLHRVSLLKNPLVFLGSFCIQKLTRTLILRSRSNNIVLVCCLTFQVKFLNRCSGWANFPHVILFDFFSWVKKKIIALMAYKKHKMINLFRQEEIYVYCFKRRS
jgi:hypothetical protein